MTVLSPSDWLKQPDTLIVAQSIDTQPRLLSNLLDSQSCFHALSIEPGVDSRSRGCQLNPPSSCSSLSITSERGKSQRDSRINPHETRNVIKKTGFAFTPIVARTEYRPMLTNRRTATATHNRASNCRTR